MRFGMRFAAQRAGAAPECDPACLTCLASPA